MWSLKDSGGVTFAHIIPSMAANRPVAPKRAAGEATNPWASTAGLEVLPDPDVPVPPPPAEAVVLLLRHTMPLGPEPPGSLPRMLSPLKSSQVLKMSSVLHK